MAEVQTVVDQVLTLSKRYASGPNNVRVSSTSSNKEFEHVRCWRPPKAGLRSQPKRQAR